MAEKKSIYLHNGLTSFVAMHVSSDLTEAEAQKLSIRRKSPPDRELHHLTFDSEFSFGTSFVCLDSSLYCIGGTKILNYLCEPTNEVSVFDTTQLEDKPHQSFHRYPSLMEERCFAQVVAVDGKIYAFGGISLSKEILGEGVWAEYLELYSASPQWKPLSEPPSRILAKDKPFSMLLSDGKIFIGPTDITKEGIIYDVNEGCWEKHNLNTGSLPKMNVPPNPVYVENDNTMYWLFQEWLHAVDLNTGIHYCSEIGDSVLSEMHYMLELTYWGPILMHLKDDVFCFFTVYKERPNLRAYGVVECTKFRVSKGASEAGEGNLNICILGYQSDKCDPMWNLCCAVPIAKSINVSKTRKRKRVA